ncbi:hypothetical protein [Cyclobacterium plantarum]|uniref:hypothetical protein n=1 Tax=Cyclobacterium plantarum TaxID=2716263 RepID=UPI003F71996E
MKKKLYALTSFATILVVVITSCGTTGQVNKDNLIGNWATSPDENVEFTITDKNIKYFEDDYLYTYEIKRNTFSLIDSGHLIANYEIMSLTTDSLIWKTESGNVLRLVKRK